LESLVNSPSQRFLIICGGLSGALGVALSAVAAHRADLPNLGTAANMLLFHAPAFLAIGLASGNKVRTITSFVLLAGLALFAGDLLARAFLGTRLFPMAAPTGGILLIAGWIGVAASAFIDKKL
jgi:uncharacterized membrane protein YgdD (TMEM256/DUF423 family)